MYGEDENNFSHENEKDENENGDEIYCINISFIFIIFEHFIEHTTYHSTNVIGVAIKCEQ
jgi:hypothetical protein